MNWIKTSEMQSLIIAADTEDIAETAFAWADALINFEEQGK